MVRLFDEIAYTSMYDLASLLHKAEVGCERAWDEWACLERWGTLNKHERDAEKLIEAARILNRGY